MNNLSRWFKDRAQPAAEYIEEQELKKTEAQIDATDHAISSIKSSTAGIVHAQDHNKQNYASGGWISDTYTSRAPRPDVKRIVQDSSLHISIIGLLELFNDTGELDPRQLEIVTAKILNLSKNYVN